MITLIGAGLLYLFKDDEEGLAFILIGIMCISLGIVMEIDHLIGFFSRFVL